MDYYVEKFISNNNLTLVSKFDALWPGWDCDDSFYLCKREDGTFTIVGTNHGAPCFYEESQLEERVSYYEKVIKETKNAISLLKK